MNQARVLFWIRRRTAPRGGDLVALENTIAALRAYNIECAVSDDPAHDLSGYTLVHLYNLSHPTVAVEYVARATDAGKPLVVTPIYWSHAQWLETRARSTSATRPEFFLGALSDDERALSQRVLLVSEQLGRAVHQLVCDAAARIFTFSRAEDDILAREFRAAREKLHVTYNGIDPAFQHGDAERFFKTRGLRDFVLSAARIEERKNTIGIIRAWRDETIPLVLAGNAPDADYLALCQREAGTNTHFLGALAPAQMADAFAAARVHVLASWWEEASLSALEAGLAGCNLAMTENSSAREYFGDMCFLCDPSDPQSIQAAIRAAYDTPRHTELAAHLRENFTWERVARVLSDAYAEIAAEPQSFLPRAGADEWKGVSEPLAELLYLRETYLRALETRTREQTAWARELERIIAARDAERARWLPLARLRQTFSRRP